MPVKRFFLHGIDYFQLLIDHHGKKRGGRGHEAHLSILLEGHIPKDAIEQLFEVHPVLKKIINLRISKSFGIGYPSVYQTNRPAQLPVSFSSIDSGTVPFDNLNYSIDPYNEPPLFIQVLYMNNNTTCLLFTFHHILFDFSGVQSFIFSLSDMKDLNLFSKKIINRSINSRLKGFFKEIIFTFREANAHMTIPEAALPAVKPVEIEFKEIIFSKSEAEAMESIAANLGVTLNKSLYYLTSCCLSLHKVIFNKQNKHNFIWIPVPVNKRLKGKDTGILFNDLTFLFYKIRKDELLDKKNVVKVLKKQMMHQIRNEMPDAFIDFVEGYKYMPLPFYYPMLNLPSWGKLSSFSFSVLGKTFEGLDSLFGHRIIDIKNYPSNSVSPGITFLFYTYKSELRLMTSWVKGQYSSEKQNEVLDKLKSILTNSEL